MLGDGGVGGVLRAARTMVVTPAGRAAGLRWWPAGLAWALWALAILSLLVTAWLDHLLRQAGRPDLAQETAGVDAVLAVLVAAGSLVVRFRRAHGVARQQLRWVALAAAVVAPAALVLLAAVAATFLLAAASTTT